MHAAPNTDVVRYQFADLTIYPGQRRVVRGEREIPMGPLTYRLLSVLVEAAPNVVTQSELFERVWTGRIVCTTTLTQRVKLLRQALSDESASPRYIGLARRFGYQLIPPVQAQYAPLPSRRSLAVLPFDNLSHARRDELFAAGIHEEILTALCRVAKLDVIARTSVKQYQNTRHPITAIAAELGVDEVIEGSIRYANRRVRITAQLIDGTSGSHVWAEVYEHEIGDDFQIQSDVASRIAAAIAARPADGRHAA